MKLIEVFKKRYENLNITVKVAGWYTFCNVLQRGISIITVPIFSRIMSTEQYGLYNIYLSWLNILSILTCLNLYYGVFNKAMVKYKDDIDRYISSMQGLIVCLTSFFFIFYLLFKDRFNSYFGLSTTIMIMMFIEMLVTPSLQFWSGRQRFEYKYKKLVKVSIVKTILNPLLGIIAVFISERKTEARIMATVLVELLICGWIMIYQFRKGKSFYNREYWKYSVLFNIPLIPHYLSGSILNQGDKIVIQKIQTESEVAFYSVAYSVGMLTQLITNAIAQAVTPWIYKKLEEKEYRDINPALNALMIFVCSGCVAMMLFAPEIVKIFAAKQYSQAINVIPPISASVFFIFVYNIFSNFEFYFEKRAFITIASGFSAIVNIVLNIIFVPVYGYVAAAYTTLACYALYSFLHFLFSNAICLKKSGEGKVFTADILITCSVVLVFSCIISTMLYRNIVVRYFILLMGLAVCYLYKDRLKSIISILNLK